MKQSLGNRIADSIFSNYIDNGLVKPGERLPTMLELRHEYSTSDTTIQRALSILEMRGVVDKRHGSGCYVSEAADMKSLQPAKMIGCISSFQDTVVMMRSYEGIERVCSKRGYNIVVGNTRDDYETEQIQVKRMIDMGCQAIILYPVPRTQKQLRQDYLKSEYRDFPIVLLDSGHPEQERPMVVFDNYRAGYDMTRFLINEGHRRIAFMMYDHVDSELLVKPTTERYRGFLDALDSVGLSFNLEDRWLISGLSGKKRGNETLEPVYRLSHKDMDDRLVPVLSKWREQSEHPTAIIAIEDSYASHTIRLARKLNIVVPKELRVVGFDNLWVDDFPIAHFPTTTPDYTRAGEVLTEMAIDYASGKVQTPSTYIYVLSAAIWYAPSRESECELDLETEGFSANKASR